MTRDEAIAWLRSMGRNASARDWVYGATIVITMGGPPTLVDAGSVYPGVIYLYPAGDGSWNLLAHGVPDPAERYDDLESAVRGAHEYIARWERDRGKHE